MAQENCVELLLKGNVKEKINPNSPEKPPEISSVDQKEVLVLRPKESLKVEIEKDDLLRENGNIFGGVFVLTENEVVNCQALIPNSRDEIIQER